MHRSGRIRPPFDSLAKFVIAGSISVTVRTGTTIARTSSDDAAASVERMKNVDCGAVSGLKTTAARARPGAIFLSRSSHFPPIEK